ncbi:hypothetical protein Ddye_018375 [Dipteronia dyeriana]|uniref:RING-type E3 ubiquitin transferase n=1 Tax=Dipteronia dyeriana TaxID=168575 RepID=A0AAD9UAX9_9ROSI|nr:hypothetical protein Ddye_018375 [Dipteronia dyeriana]
MATTSPSPPYLSSFAPPYVEPQEPKPSHSMDKFKPSIIIITLILSITVLLSISICLLLRHLNRRCLRHLSTAASMSVASDSRRVNSARRVSPVNPPTTTSSSSSAVVDSLPLFTYSSITRRSTSVGGGDGGDCAVCLSKFEPQDQLRLLPICCHAFHAECIDTWLDSNLTCPLCRSPINASEADMLKALQASSAVAGANDSFRVEIGSISRRGQAGVDQTLQGRSYSLGSYEYVMEEDAGISSNQTNRTSVSDKEEVAAADLSRAVSEPNLVSDVAAGRSWLKDYVDRLSYSFSSRTMSFRSSGRFFTGSSRRSDVAGIGDYDLEANQHVGEEISELFRWFSGV